MLPAIAKSSSLARIGWLIAAALVLAAIPGAMPVRATGNIKTYTTVQDFGATCGGGPQLTDVVVTEDDNGEIALRASLEDYFYTGSLDNGLWSTGNYGTSPTITVSGGMLTITSSADLSGGAYVASQTTQHYGALEGRVQFSNGQSQHFGWADPPGFSNFAIFSTFNTTDTLYVRTLSAGGNNVVVQSPLITTSQRLRIEWADAGAGNDLIRYLIDGTAVHTETISALSPTQMRATLSNDTQSAVKTLSADWIRYMPYAATGAYLSCPFNAMSNSIQTWGPISWTESKPTGTTLVVEVQTSDDASTWSPLVAVANNTVPNIPDSKYIRYKVTLGTIDPAVTSKLNALSIGYADPPAISIGDASLAEGNSGAANMNFTVSLSGTSVQDVTVQYATADDTATTAGNDYTATSGTLTIPAGNLTGTISVPIKGDTTVEAGKTFFVNLSSPTRATIADAQAVGTITNDDSTEISIDDASLAEGNSGTSNMTFTVSLSNPSASTIQVGYTTANDTASSGSDYTATSGTLTFPIGVTTQTITVTVNGDTTIEQNEMFFVNLSTPSGATIADNQAVGTITNDDALPPPNIIIDDPIMTEGNSGTRNISFTVSLSAASNSVVQVNYATANNSATAPSDYVAKSGTLTFPVGTTTRTITVQVIGDTLVEGNEVYFINLSNSVGATIADSQGIGTILNDDSSQHKLYLPMVQR
jgi:hypothetical protein